MTGLVRADTELMLLTSQEMQRASSIILEQFDSARRAMESLQSSRWSGRHRELIEERWLVLVGQFHPTTTKLDEIAARLKRTAESLDVAAFTFGNGASIAGGSFIGNLGALLGSLSPDQLISLGLNPYNPALILNTLLNSPHGQALLAAGAGLFDPALASTNTELPHNGGQDLVIAVNGINSHGVAGEPDESVLKLRDLLIARGLDPNNFLATPAVYNTNHATTLSGTNRKGTKLNPVDFEGTTLGGWLSPIDWVSGGGTWVANNILDGLAAEVNLRTGNLADSIDVVTAGGAMLINESSAALNTAVGVDQTKNEYILQENGFYTEQTMKAIRSHLATHPLKEGQQITLVGHSGGGAIVANLSEMLEKEGYPVDRVLTMGSPVSNYDNASKYADITEIRDANDLIGTPIVRSGESRATIPLGLAGMGLMPNPVIPVGVLGGDQLLRNNSSNITSVITRSEEGEHSTVAAHTSYWESVQVHDIILNNMPGIAPAGQRSTTKRGVTN